MSDHESPSFWTGKTPLPLPEILPTTTKNFPYKNWENSLYLNRKFPDLNQEIPYLDSVSQFFSEDGFREAILQLTSVP